MANRHNRHRGGGGGGRAPLDAPTSFAPDSPVLALFRAAAAQLTARHDRHERLVKLSRDLTIESKRIIFLLHSAVRAEDSATTLREARDRLDKLVNTTVRAVAVELQHSPAHLHARAVAPGLQEFVEAKTLYHLLEHDALLKCSDVQAEFKYTVRDGDGEDGAVECLLPPTDFMLGVADLTGELMRRTINSLSSGDAAECRRCCQVVRDLYTGFLGVQGCGARDVMRKLSTVRANVGKVEMAAYALRVRGGETPPALLLPAHDPPRPDLDRLSDDEGYY